MPGIYAADVYCDSCIASIKASIKADLRRKGLEPENSGDERTYDSNDWPKWLADSAEADAPQHCGSGDTCLEAVTLADGRVVGAVLGALTPAGEAYVRLYVRARPGDALMGLWLSFYGMAV